MCVHVSSTWVDINLFTEFQLPMLPDAGRFVVVYIYQLTVGQSDSDSLAPSSKNS